MFRKTLTAGMMSFTVELLRSKGAEVVLIERRDMLLGTGLVGGIMRNDGRYTAAGEMKAMSGGELFDLTDQNSLHRRVDFPGRRQTSLYNVANDRQEIAPRKRRQDREGHLDYGRGNAGRPDRGGHGKAV